MIAFSDNGAAGDSTDSPQSKKAKVLRLARTDPFLSVDEIARAVGTTSRYVRTSLSEAGLTLTELRRRFARDLRRRMSAADSSDDGVAVRTRLARPPTEPHRRVPSSPSETRLRVAQRIDADLAALLGEAPEAPLLEISRVRWSEGQPLYVNQLVTNQYVTVSEELLASDDPLHNLMGGENGSWEPTVVKRTVDIVPAAEFIAESLRLPRRPSDSAFQRPDRDAQAPTAGRRDQLFRCPARAGRAGNGVPPAAARSSSAISRARPNSNPVLAADRENTKKAARMAFAPQAASIWQGRQDSNPQPPVLETGALPLSYSPRHMKVYHVPARSVKKRTTPSVRRRWRRGSVRGRHEIDNGGWGSLPPGRELLSWQP